MRMHRHAGTLGGVPVKVVFRCEICGCAPGAETQRSLERQLLDLRHGEYVDAEPERWLVWHGRGIYGPTRYACGSHRGELKALLREQYGMLGWHPWARGRTRGPAGAAPTARAGSGARSWPGSAARPPASALARLVALGDVPALRLLGSPRLQLLDVALDVLAPSS